MEQTLFSFTPNMPQAASVSTFTASEAPAGDAEGIEVPAEYEAGQQPPREENEDHVVPASLQTEPLLPMPEQQLQRISNRIDMTCDLPQHRTHSSENPSSGSSAGTNQITADHSSEGPRESRQEHAVRTPSVQPRTARMRTTLPTDTPYIEEVAPEKGPLTGGMRIYIIGDNFPENDHLYVRFGNSFARAVSVHHSTWLIW